MSPDPELRRRPSRARIIRATVAALCAVSVSLTPLIAPSAGLAQSSLGVGGPASSGTPPPSGPVKPPTGSGGGKPFCRSKLCQKIVEAFCKRINCAKLSEQFRQTGRDVRNFTNRNKPPADKFRNRTGWELHHIVQVGKNKGLSDFAQTVLERAGVKANVDENLVYLRGRFRQEGTQGYKDLSSTLQKRLFHADVRTDYYYQMVNERLSQLIRQVGNDPTEAQVKAVLQKINDQLAGIEKGGNKLIEPGKTPRSSDLS